MSDRRQPRYKDDPDDPNYYRDWYVSWVLWHRAWTARSLHPSPAARERRQKHWPDEDAWCVGDLLTRTFTQRAFAERWDRLVGPYFDMWSNGGMALGERPIAPLPSGSRRASRAYRPAPMAWPPPNPYAQASL